MLYAKTCSLFSLPRLGSTSTLRGQRHQLHGLLVLSPAPPIQWSICQSSFNRKCTSIQLLDILRESLQAGEVHLHFDHTSTHTRCALCLNNSSLNFTANAGSRYEDVSDAGTERSLGVLDVPEEMSPSRYLQEMDMPEHYSVFIMLATATLMSDPTRASAAEALDKVAQITN